MDEFHHDCFVFAKELAAKLEIEVKKPRTYQRQRFRQNSVVSCSGSSLEEAAQHYFRINVTILLVIAGMKTRFQSG